MYEVQRKVYTHTVTDEYVDFDEYTTFTEHINELSNALCVYQNALRDTMSIGTRDKGYEFINDQESLFKPNFNHYYTVTYSVAKDDTVAYKTFVITMREIFDKNNSTS